MTTTSEMQTVRRLGLLEAGSAAFHLMGLYRSVVVSATYSIPSREQSKEAMLAALGGLINDNPMLRVGIKDEGSTIAYFTHISEMKLKDFVEFRTSASDLDFSKDLKHLHCWCHDQIFQDVETRPPWRVFVLRPDGESPAFEAVVFAFHHSLMDGMGGRLFHEKLLTKLNSLPPNPSPPAVLSFPECPVLPEPQDNVIDYTTTLSRRFSGLLNWMRPSFFTPTHEIWSAEPVEFSRPHKTRLAVVDIPPDVMKSVLAATRSYRTSLTGLLHALALASLSRRVPDAPGFTSSTPISMRPYISPTADPAQKEALFGCVTGTAHEHLSAELAALRSAQGEALDDLVWSHARKIKEELKQKTSTLPATDGLKALRSIKDWTEFLIERDGSKRRRTWEVSNLGMLTEPAENGPDKRTILHAMFTNGPMISSDPMSISVVSVKNGMLTLGITWNDSSVDEKLMEGLRGDLESSLKQLHEEGDLCMHWLYEEDSEDEA
ncbi:hypothetical protein FVEN_g5173 [Fusarium venenatum]|uniref:Alcohol acetyltransferase FCK4 n=1 Tax=Fusarium venenatum TaxID=56646 RepID=A0A2L2SXK7_9HYPO|nr:uncharacterized protein FVRRES_07080 [Fusarium venenatum]KAG8357087.1 hypothetical protein FVEN_g5173 [Fusarium venenatum]KAH6994030.1 alcohol acetyltransferase [Fusarium venenatum]CEI62644.1 unnamed protein product [Fusarium venenatum]